ncbi:hypothetical protein ACS0TY_008079 [Phlomoides rotata]
MEDERGAKSYEDARKQRLLENKRRFEELGLEKLSKGLSDMKKSEKPKKQNVRLKGPKPTDIYAVEPRRSSRARNAVSSYRDDVDVGLPSLRKRSKFDSSWASYLARPVEEVKVASYEERAQTYKYAEKLQSNLQTGNPSFVKSMLRSHVYSCFWLGLPTRFCEDHLPKSTVDIVLENEEGSEYGAIFISKRTGLSGGWRAFALDHKLDDGDALVFELIEPTRFKVHIVRATDCKDQNEEVESDAERTSKREMKNMKKVSSPELQDPTKSKTKKSTKNTKKDGSPELQDSTKSKTKKSSQVSATRRSLRKR